MRPYRFFFHFNKPLSRQRGKPQISVHYRGVCHIADNVVCWTPVAGRISKRQPLFVMTGSCPLEEFWIGKDNVIFLGLTKSQWMRHTYKIL